MSQEKQVDGRGDCYSGLLKGAKLRRPDMEKKGATKTKSQNSAQKFRTDPWLTDKLCIHKGRLCQA